MDLLKNEKKYGGEEPPEQVPTRVCHAIIYGGYGCYLNERAERINHRAQLETTDDNEKVMKRLIDPEGVWRDRRPIHDRLYLSPEETIFLSIDTNVLVVSENKKELTSGELWLRMKDLGGPSFLRRYVLYRYLRNNGWCIRSGLPYGCEYLIYKGNPESHHAAAGVKMESQMDAHTFIGFNRTLTNMKKALVIVTPLVPEGLNTNDHRSAESVKLLMSTSTTMFVERKMNDMKKKEFEEYKRNLKRKAE
ncbi:putative tRNA intron endonuclease [Teladorsagia circumcincta]|uniref:tRNA-intron lyase n=1 Tax=Teladorsagia circumcincta TaxID=45464 RepID=A0A2G9U8M0_TELCI|nr:putative tRNA intron endonuclease [Teladorsagia circumcincta]